jgi:predicted transcriptional regulator
MMTKISRTYRLSNDSLCRIEWLASRLNTPATNVVERAVEELFERERERIRAHLVPLENGLYEFRVDGLPIAVVDQKTVSRMGEHADELLSDRGGSENAFGVLMLCAAVEKAPIEIHQENLERVYSGLVAAVEG